MNLSRLFVEKRQVAWVALIATLLWGIVAYGRLPQRKDPEIVIKTAVITIVWPGANAQDVEQLVTRAVEQTARQVPKVDKVVSTTRTGISTVFVTLEDTARRSDVDVAWADLRARVDLLAAKLPVGTAAPLVNTSFGDTATMVFSVASPLVDDIELDIRADAIRQAIAARRALRPNGKDRVATVFLPADGLPRASVASAVDRYLALGVERRVLVDAEIVRGSSFIAVDAAEANDEALRELLADFRANALGGEVPHPDAWGAIHVRGLDELRPKLALAAHEKYGYRQLDDFTAAMRDELARVPEVARVERYGVVPEVVYLLYAQERLAAFGLQPAQISLALRARNPSMPGGAIGTGYRAVLVDPSGSVTRLDELLDAVVGTSKEGRPVYLRDVADVHRTYETPASDASWLTWRDDHGWHRTRSVAVAVQVRSGVQATAVGIKLDAVVAGVMSTLPSDLVLRKTSDQPALVREKIGDFLRALGEAIAIVIAIALVFMERRSALLVAASIPLTLALTFGLMALFGLDLQQVSIAALIISLGLLVDDPVIAGDAINRELAAGSTRERAAWEGPTKLAKAILYATLTNIVAFAPLLLVTGSMGEFIYSLPMVVVLSLVSSRIVSMTFMPLLGYYLLRGQKGYEAALQGTGTAARFARGYNRATEWVLEHKGKSIVGFLLFLVVGLAPASQIRTQFFPEEALERFYVHVRLPEGSDVRATAAAAQEAETAVVESEGERVEQVTTFVGNGGPRWWSNVSPEPKNPAYALLIVKARHADDSMAMIGRLQRFLRGRVAGARTEVYRVSSGKPAVTPVEVRVAGPDVAELRRLAEQVKDALRASPRTYDAGDDWGADNLKLTVKIDVARAASARVSNADIASASAMAFSGAKVTSLREQDRLIDVVMRLRPTERRDPSRLRNLYVWSTQTGMAVPIEQVARLSTEFEPQKIVRQDLERTITVGAVTKDGELASALFADAKPAIDRIKLPPGYSMTFGGEQEMQAKAFASVSIALKVSVALIFLTLVWQFANVFKPLIVFAAIPFGMVGVVLGLVVTKTNFGFMAFLGVTSLIGVIVSHIIVLFDFIEEAREHGTELHRAVIDAGLVRLRPVLVTVLATVGGLVPLALEGGPMWRQLVYVQIGGLLLATLVTKGVVPLLYVLFVETLHLVEWKNEQPHDTGGGQ
ncbi:MAG: efflux RND transporter permease subunit [Myxococcales bacterium]|nr:efflux RND transporter permease subunit [Myxococcales bacterium]